MKKIVLFFAILFSVSVQAQSDFATSNKICGVLSYEEPQFGKPGFFLTSKTETYNIAYTESFSELSIILENHDFDRSSAGPRVCLKKAITSISEVVYFESVDEGQ